MRHPFPSLQQPGPHAIGSIILHSYLVRHQLIDDLFSQQRERRNNFCFDLLRCAVLEQAPAPLSHVLLLSKHCASCSARTQRCAMQLVRSCEAAVCLEGDRSWQCPTRVPCSGFQQVREAFLVTVLIHRSYTPSTFRRKHNEEPLVRVRRH